AGRIDQYVDATERPQDVDHGSLDSGRVAQIEHEDPGVGACPFGLLRRHLCTVRMAIDHGDVGPGGGEFEDRGAPDTRSSTCYERHLALKGSGVPLLVHRPPIESTARRHGTDVR